MHQYYEILVYSSNRTLFFSTISLSVFTLSAEQSDIHVAARQPRGAREGQGVDGQGPRTMYSFSYLATLLLCTHVYCAGLIADVRSQLRLSSLWWRTWTSEDARCRKGTSSLYGTATRRLVGASMRKHQSTAALCSARITFATSSIQVQVVARGAGFDARTRPTLVEGGVLQDVVGARRSCALCDVKL
jgi:hypothetical protein